MCRLKLVADAVQVVLEHPDHTGPCDLDSRAVALLTKATRAAIRQHDHDPDPDITHVVAMGFTTDRADPYSIPTQQPDPYEDST